MTVMLDGSLSYDIWLRDHLGRRWDLLGEDEGNRGVILETLDAAENSPSRELTSTANQIGERIGGQSIPALQPSLTVSINTRQFEEAFDDWEEAWRQGHDNTLFVRSPRKHRVKRLDIRKRVGKNSPDAEPYQSGLDIQTLDLLALQGVWCGGATQLSQGDTWHNTGDLPPAINYYPKRSGAISLTVNDDTWTATHTTAVAGSRVDLEPEQMMKTYVNNIATPDIWHHWRNQWNPLSVAPGEVLRVPTLTGGDLTVIPRYLTPW